MASHESVYERLRKLRENQEANLVRAHREGHQSGLDWAKRYKIGSYAMTPPPPPPPRSQPYQNESSLSEIGDSATPTAHTSPSKPITPIAASPISKSLTPTAHIASLEPENGQITPYSPSGGGSTGQALDKIERRRSHDRDDAQKKSEGIGRKSSTAGLSLDFFSKYTGTPSAQNTLTTKEQEEFQAFKSQFPLPLWAKDIPQSARSAKNSRRPKGEGEIQTALSNLRDAIDKAMKSGNSIERRENFGKLRRLLHEFEYKTVTDVLIVKSKLLDPAQGLPRLQSKLSFNPEIPFDVVADSKMLYNRWFRQDFSGDLMRGIITIGKTRKLDKDYIRYKKTLGDMHLVNGKWWPFRICALADGAHAEMQAGIHGEKGVGAHSVILSKSEYEDIDDGEILKYTGTKGTAEEVSNDTQLLMTSLSNSNPVRVLRSSKHPGRFAPSHGIRYDGLYTVTQKELLHAQTSHYRFTLERRPGQDPIRYQGEGRRPTDEDIRQFGLEEQNGKSSDW